MTDPLVTPTSLRRADQIMQTPAADLRDAIAVALAEGPPNRQQWTCFHCSETFTTVGAARDHFGATPDAQPGCLLEYRVALEEGGTPERGRGLQMALRKAEAERDRLKTVLAGGETGMTTLRAQVAALHAPRGLVVVDTVLRLIDEAMKRQEVPRG